MLSRVLLDSAVFLGDLRALAVVRTLFGLYGSAAFPPQKNSSGFLQSGWFAQMPWINLKIVQGVCQMIPDDEPMRQFIGGLMSTALKTAWAAASACKQDSILFQTVKCLLILEIHFR
jgi:hypothetical protein